MYTIYIKNRKLLLAKIYISVLEIVQTLRRAVASVPDRGGGKDGKWCVAGRGQSCQHRVPPGKEDQTGPRNLGANPRSSATFSETLASPWALQVSFLPGKVPCPPAQTGPQLCFSPC